MTKDQEQGAGAVPSQAVSDTKLEASARQFITDIDRVAPETSLFRRFINALGIGAAAGFLNRNILEDGKIRTPLCLTRKEGFILDSVCGHPVRTYFRREWCMLALAGLGLLEQKDNLDESTAMYKAAEMQRDQVWRRNKPRYDAIENLPREQQKEAKQRVIAESSSTLERVRRLKEVSDEQAWQGFGFGGGAILAGGIAFYYDIKAGKTKDKQIKNLTEDMDKALHSLIHSPGPSVSGQAL